MKFAKAKIQEGVLADSNGNFLGLGHTGDKAIKIQMYANGEMRNSEASSDFEKVQFKCIAQDRANGFSFAMGY